MNRLILITNKFPFDSGEEFINEEIHYLAKAYNTVEIISRSNNLNLTRNIPSNVIIHSIPSKSTMSKKLYSIIKLLPEITLIIQLIYQEIKAIKNIYKLELNKQIIFQLIQHLFKAIELKNDISAILNNNPNNSRITLYSYWQNTAATSISLLNKQNSKLTTVCRAHRGDLYFDRSESNYLPFRQFISQNISKLIFISQDGLDYQSNLLKKNYSNYFLSRLGTKKTKSDVPKIKYSNTYKLIISCSNTIPVKRVHLIIESLNLINNCKIKWIHIGDGKLQSEISNHAHNLLIPKNNIEFEFLGKLKNEDIHKLYSKYHVDIFINVSESEGIPVSLMEAMSYGIPVIATDVGGTRELLQDAGGILLPKAFNLQELSNHITTLLEDEKYWIKISNSSQLYWKKEYFADSNFKKFIKLIKDENRS